MSGGLIFQVPQQVDMAALWEEIGNLLTIRETGEEAVNTLHLDTFDWRLFNVGMMLSLTDKKYVLRRSFGELICQGKGTGRKHKTFVWNFQDGDLQDTLKPIVDVRALQQKFGLARTIKHYGLLNRDEKTVLRLTYIETVGQYENQQFVIQPVLQVEALRGYYREKRRISDLLAASDLTMCGGGYDLVADVHAVLSINPALTDSTFSVELGRVETVSEVARDICLKLRKTTMLNLPGVVDDIDSEFLHDLRVSVRRTRSLISLLKKYLPTTDTAHFSKEFKWLGNVTGPVRDLDVYLIKESEYRAMLPPELQGGLVWFFAGLSRQRKRELRLLRQHLSSSRFTTLMEKWQEFLIALPDRDDCPRGKKLCYGVAEKIIRKRFTRILKDGTEINRISPAEKLHELRIEGKKFRYTLEFFRSMFNTNSVGVFSKQMKKFQNNLGDFNDLSVQKELLLKKLGNLRGGNTRTVETAAALGGLIVHLGDQQGRVRTSFERIFKSFSETENIDLFESIFIDAEVGHPEECDEK